jgi:epoxyqueuosine reductase
MKRSPQDAGEVIRAKALDVGFDGARITSASLPREIAERLNTFLEDGRHGDMDWLKERKEQRAHPQNLWPDAKSAIVVVANYGPNHDPMAELRRKTRGVVSVYAQNKDYHDVLKKRLKRLGRWMGETFECELKVFVDTAPVMEKPLAAQAGAGWQGKHTNLVSRTFGSWLFIGVIYTTLELHPDSQENDHCGTCSNCLDICPTDAFPAPYQLDARRCISYLTIEHKGSIPREFRKPMGNRIYGCDDCLAVCPWNKFAERARDAAFHPRKELRAPLLKELAALDDVSFRQFFSGSPIKRIGRDRFVRNVAIAIGNSGEPALFHALNPLLKDENALVRGAAVWAAAQLIDPAAFFRLYTEHASTEKDASVLGEWDAAQDQASTVT